MPIGARWAALAIGALGTGLALLTAWNMALGPAGTMQVPVLSRTLFAMTVLAGGLQWVLFHRRRFREAVILFGLTPILWFAALLVIPALSPDCRKTQCVFIVHASGALDRFGTRRH